MKRPLFGSICILIILGAGLYFAWEFKDSQTQPGRSAFEGAAARSAIQAWLDLPLPPTATDVHCAMEEIENAKLVYVRFDVPPIELPSLFDQQPRFPAAIELKPDDTLFHAMSALADPLRPWWQMEQLKSVRCAQKLGKRNVAPASLKWRTQVCAAGVSPEVTRVFIAFSEEPAER